jgi:hypothetical protein
LKLILIYISYRYRKEKGVAWLEAARSNILGCSS